MVHRYLNWAQWHHMQWARIVASHSVLYGKQFTIVNWPIDPIALITTNRLTLFTIYAYDNEHTAHYHLGSATGLDISYHCAMVLRILKWKNGFNSFGSELERPETSQTIENNRIELIFRYLSSWIKHQISMTQEDSLHWKFHWNFHWFAMKDTYNLKIAFH